MKKLMSVMAMATLSTFMLAGCDSMSPREQRIGAAALGGAVGGGVGNQVGGGIGAAVGGGAGARPGRHRRTHHPHRCQPPTHRLRIRRRQTPNRQHQP